MLFALASTIYSSFPVTKALEIVPDEDIAKELGDEIEGVNELDLSGRGG